MLTVVLSFFLIQPPKFFCLAKAAMQESRQSSVCPLPRTSFVLLLKDIEASVLMPSNLPTCCPTTRLHGRLSALLGPAVRQSRIWLRLQLLGSMVHTLHWRLVETRFADEKAVKTASECLSCDEASSHGIWRCMRA